MSEGLLSDLFKQMIQMGIPVRPRLENNIITIEFTEEEFKQAVTKGADPRFKQALSIKFVEGKMIIKIKLF